MKLLAQEDIAAPMDQVWRDVTNFEGFERSAMRRGVSVRRTDRRATVEEGSSWAIDFEYRGRDRKARAHLMSVEADQGYQIDVQSSGIESPVHVMLVPLSRTRTRLTVAVEMKATTLAGRILLQTIKLARGMAQRRLSERVARFAEAIESGDTGR